MEIKKENICEHFKRCPYYEKNKIVCNETPEEGKIYCGEFRSIENEIKKRK